MKNAVPFRYNDIASLAYALPGDVQMLREAGDFDGELALIEKKLSGEMTLAMRTRLSWEAEIAQVMQKNYHTTKTEMLALLQEKYPQLTMSAIDDAIATGHADYILRGGEVYFENSAFSNLSNQCGDLFYAACNPGYQRPVRINEDIHRRIDEMQAQGYMSRRFRLRYTLSLAEECQDEADGQTLRIHIPYPQDRESQSEVRLFTASHDFVISDAEQRTAFLETQYHRGDTYSIEFGYVNTAVYHEPKAEEVSAEQPRFYLDEEYPHIRFTPYMKALAKEIAGDETNPLLLARKVYDYVTMKIRYSYMRPYFAIDNIPEFCVLNGRGDCGVQALVFITLCRILGVPAKWQSGLGGGDHGCGPHDWAMFYVAPYGWLYADPSYGGGAYLNGDEGMRLHYFGNLDAYRLVTCTEFQREFDPPRRFLRNDPYDNQSGEIELPTRPLHDEEICTLREVVSCEKLTAGDRT